MCVLPEMKNQQGEFLFIIIEFNYGYTILVYHYNYSFQGKYIVIIRD